MQTETAELVTTERRRRPARSGTDGSWRATVYERGTRNEATATGRSKDEAILAAFEALSVVEHVGPPPVTIDPSRRHADHNCDYFEEDFDSTDATANDIDDDDTWLPWRFDRPTRTWLFWAAMALMTAVAIYPLLLRAESAPAGFDGVKVTEEIRFDLAQAGTATSDQCQPLTVRLPKGLEATDLQCFTGGLQNYSGVELSCEPTSSVAAHASWDVCLRVDSWASTHNESAPTRPFIALVPVKGPLTSAKCAHAVFTAERSWLLCVAQVAVVLALLAGIGFGVRSAASRFGWPRLVKWCWTGICLFCREVFQALSKVPYRVLVVIWYAMVLLVVAREVHRWESRQVEAVCNTESSKLSKSIPDSTNSTSVVNPNAEKHSD